MPFGRRRRKMRQPGRVSARIVARLIEHDALDATEYPPETLHIARTYAGRHQRSEGAWSWELEGLHRAVPFIGSQWPAATVAAWEDWQLNPSAGGLNIDPGPIEWARLVAKQVPQGQGT